MTLQNAINNNIIHSRKDIEDIQRTSSSVIITSKEIEPGFKFDSLTISVSALLPLKSAIIIEIQASKERQTSPWMQLARLEHGGGESFGTQENDLGKIETDIFMAKDFATSYKYRLTITGRASVNVTAAALTEYQKKFDVKQAAANTSKAEILLNVAPISQMEFEGKEKKSICSPSCLAMLLNFYGQQVKLKDIVKHVYDPQAKIYGNWINNVACAGSFGLNARIARFDSLEQVYEELVKGIPIIASISYKKDELKNAHTAQTAGHLVLIKGFDAKGNVIVNDPAALSAAQVSTIYDRRQFSLAWLKNKNGLAYLIERTYL